MADNSWYSFSEPLNSGIDFYQADSNDVVVVLSASASLSVNAVKLIDISSSLSSSSELSANAMKISYAAASLSVEGATLTIATERQDALVSISAETQVSTNITKIAFASSSIEASTDIQTSAKEILLAAVSMSSSADLQSTITKIAKAASVITPNATVDVVSKAIRKSTVSINPSVNLSIVGKVALSTIRIAMSQFVDINVKPLTRFAQDINVGIDSGLYRTLILLDGKPLTNHNRRLDMNVEPIFTETVNWANRKNRYYKSSTRAGRRTFNLSWSNLPNSMTYTADGNKGRDFIKDIAQDPRHHVLKIINMDESGTTPYSETSYNVLVKDYSETLIRRDIPNELYLWDCSMSFEEV